MIIGVGATFALLRLVMASDESARLRVLLQGVLVQAVALIGARLAFVLAHLTYYATRKNEILNISAGGLWWPGALAGGLLAIIAIGSIQKNKVRLSLDRFSVFLLPMLLSFWLAGWSAGVAYGARLDPSVWYGIPSLDVTGVSLPRVPVQLAASLSALVIIGGIEWRLRKNLPSGRRAGFLFLVAGVHTLVFSFLRDDPIQPIMGVRLDVWVSILFVLATGILLAFTFEVKSRKIKVQKEAAS